MKAITYSTKEYELLGKQVAAGQYVSRTTFVLSLILALLLGLCLGRYIFPNQSDADFGGQKRPLGQNSGMAAAVAPNQQLLQSIFQHEEDVRRDPKNVEAWEHLGNLYYDAGEAQKSVNAYLKALELNPGNVNVIVDCGIMYLQLDKPETAVEFFDKALAIDAKHQNALFNKGVVLYHNLNKKNEAMSSWRALAAINPAFKAPSGQTIKDMIDEKAKLDNRDQTF